MNERFQCSVKIFLCRSDAIDLVVIMDITSLEKSCSRNFARKIRKL